MNPTRRWSGTAPIKVEFTRRPASAHSARELEKNPAHTKEGSGMYCKISLRFLLAPLLLLLPLGCHSATAPVAREHNCPTTAAVIPLAPPKADEITVEQLALLLPRHPIVVGFDVDDTLIFSAPAFNALQPNYDPDVIRPKAYSSLSAEQKAKYHEFWN